MRCARIPPKCRTHGSSSCFPPVVILIFKQEVKQRPFVHKRTEEPFLCESVQLFFFRLQIGIDANVLEPFIIVTKMRTSEPKHTRPLHSGHRLREVCEVAASGAADDAGGQGRAALPLMDVMPDLEAQAAVRIPMAAQWQPFMTALHQSSLSMHVMVNCSPGSRFMTVSKHMQSKT